LWPRKVPIQSPVTPFRSIGFPSVRNRRLIFAQKNGEKKREKEIEKKSQSSADSSYGKISWGANFTFACRYQGVVKGWRGWQLTRKSQMSNWSWMSCTSERNCLD
jgi:hypothetical protein